MNNFTEFQILSGWKITYNPTKLKGIVSGETDSETEYHVVSKRKDQNGVEDLDVSVKEDGSDYCGH